MTIVTLLFAPIFAHHHWMWKLVGKTKETHLEQCAANEPCPHNLRIVKIVKVAPPTPSQNGGTIPGTKNHDGSDNRNNGNNRSNGNNSDNDSNNDNSSDVVDNPSGFDAGNYGNDNWDQQGRH